MLRIVKIEKQKYDTLPLEQRDSEETLFLCTDIETGLSSIYVNGICYGEDIDEKSIESRISAVENCISTYEIAINEDVDDILKL